MRAVSRSSQPSSHDERRGVLRYPVEVEGVLSTAGGAARQVTLTDISEWGCQIVRPAELSGEGSIRLTFGGFAPFYAAVVWTSPKAAGLRFEQPVHPALVAQVVASAKGRKRAGRPLAPNLVRRAERERLWHLRTPVTFEIRAPAGRRMTPLAGTLADLSTEGCRIVTAVGLLPGTALLVSLPDRQPVIGEVRWSDAEAIGVHFPEPLAADTVASVAQEMWTESER